MRIALYHAPLYRATRGYETYGPYARYVSEFARHFDEVVVLAPTARGDTDYRGCTIDAANVRVVELPDFRTHVAASMHLPTIYRTFVREIDSVDVVNCRNTAPFGYLLYRLGRPRGIGFFYHVTSDPIEILEVGAKYRGLRGRVARSLFAVDFAIQRYVMRRTYSFVNGGRGYERLRHVTDRCEPIISSTLAQDDFQERRDCTLHRPVRLLYVGYLKHMKGLGNLIEALGILRRRGIDADLRLVGAGPERRTIEQAVSDAGLASHVQFHGYVPMGLDLNRHYDTADIFVFPSLSEGSPRVVLEALAHSLPAVTTNVGSVPDLIEDGQSGLLVPPGDAGALAAAVDRFVTDETLRRRCMAGGFAAARSHTLERFVERLANKAKELGREDGAGR